MHGDGSPGWWCCCVQCQRTVRAAIVSLTLLAAYAMRFVLAGQGVTP
ncbi:hypothetical protein A8924_5473 [Saccharopolyspora erythraea NRRL 2338]|nr:hypothetical protein A8924_5473 [Saccharopolyspora erythraea NRRL 2338]